MNVVMIYFYSKRFRFAPSFNYFTISITVLKTPTLFRLVRISSSTKNSKYLTQTLSFDEHNELTAADSMTSMHVTGYMCNSAISG